jgi:hypothetical protein
MSKKKKEQKEETKEKKNYEAEVVYCYFSDLIPSGGRQPFHTIKIRR